MGAGASVDVTVDGELAKVLSASDGDLAKAADKLNRDIKRMVPKTASGRLDAASIEEDERESVHEVLGRARRLAEHGYAVSWGYYRKTVDGGPAARDADELLVETGRLKDDFTPDTPPRCDLSRSAVDEPVAALIDLAGRHGEALIKSLEGLVQDAGGAYNVGPRKKVGRIKQKAEDEYDGDVARVVDVERATGVFESVDDLSFAISLLRAASRRGEITIRRCKDHFGQPFDTGYRDLQLNVELDGFIGELQLNLRRIVDVKKEAHTVYEVERVLQAGEGRKALRRAVDCTGLESEQVLRLRIEGGRSIDGAFGSLAVFEAALARALPSGCVVANVYSGERGEVRVRLGLDEVAAMAQLRDDVLSVAELPEPTPTMPLPVLANYLKPSTPGAQQLAATACLRKLLSNETNPPIQAVIDSGAVPGLIELMQDSDRSALQFEAAWALTNIVSGTSDHARVVIEGGAVPIFCRLLSSPNEDVREQAVWALGNIAGDSPTCRDLVLREGAMQPLLQQLRKGSKLSMLRRATWTLSNFCRGKPQPEFGTVQPALPTLAQLINSPDEEVLADAQAGGVRFSRVDGVDHTMPMPRLIYRLVIVRAGAGPSPT